MEALESALQIYKQPPVSPQWNVRARGQDVRNFILENVEKHPKNLSSLAAQHFGITRQAVVKHLRKLVAENALTPEGKTKDRSYKLATQLEWKFLFRIIPGVEEDQVWTQEIARVLGSLPTNVMDIWHFCFTEMFNNAVDHSGGAYIYITVAKTAANAQILLMDDGVGIFKKIQHAMGLLDERHAILELAKGKLTTSPETHTGQGIFFTSRLLDSFDILSGGVFFSHTFGSEEDWVLERPHAKSGTTVFMKLNNHSSRTSKSTFAQYTSQSDYGFTKTVVPVKLAQYGEDKLISRSQAKRLVARIDQFKTVIFDFEEVEAIGQAFADEIFRVFAKAHPGIELIPAKANSDVQSMINAARSQWSRDVGGV
jgi:anti-sigma regulatory factor (Ser/Thr protein kinase)